MKFLKYYLRCIDALGELVLTVVNYGRRLVCLRVEANGWETGVGVELDRRGRGSNGRSSQLESCRYKNFRDRN